MCLVHTNTSRQSNPIIGMRTHPRRHARARGREQIVGEEVVDVVPDAPPRRQLPGLLDVWCFSGGGWLVGDLGCAVD